MIYVLPIAFAMLLQQPNPAASPAPTPLDIVSALETVVADVVTKAEPSVVAIARERAGKGDETTAVRGKNVTVVGMPDGAVRFGGNDSYTQPDYVSFDFGSGVVVGPDGEMLTAFHVVRGASRLVVRAFGNQQFDAEIIAADPRSDLAILVPKPIQGVPLPKLSPITIGNGTKLRKGNFLVALGNPFNAARDGRASASLGILANIARRIERNPLVDQQQLRHYPTLLQLDSKLNLGMSGGAVVNLKGELVGLTTNAANASGFDSQSGYALPIDTLSRRVIRTLMEGREVEYGFLGIMLSEERFGQNDVRSQNDVRTNHVGNVTPGTPAADAGLIVGDRIDSVGGLKVVDSESLVTSVNAFTPGVPIILKITRQSKPVEKTIVLSKFPITGEVISTNRPAPWRGLRVDYLSMIPEANVNLGQPLLDAMSQGGVAILEVIPGSPADAAGLRSGQIVRTVNGKLVRNPKEFAAAVEGVSKDVEIGTEGDRKVIVK
jgi:S1-C subfamily serine protease